MPRRPNVDPHPPPPPPPPPPQETTLYSLHPLPSLYSLQVQEALKHLADHTLDAYGDVGIFDPEELARIDFLNRPELLVQLVQGSKNRMSRVDKADMLMMTEVRSFTLLPPPPITHSG